MMGGMKQKKLLLLGGLRYLLPVIEAAHKLGYYVITCDYIPGNIAHKYSDEYHNVSIIDKEAVLALARELEIDGIMSFAVDPGVVTAAYVQDQMGLPGNPYESVKILQNKDRFRRFLSEYGFNVPWAFGFSSVGDTLLKSGEFTYPLIVKPNFGGGSNGIINNSITYNKSQTINLIKKLNYYQKMPIIVEEYIPGYEVSFIIIGNKSKIIFSGESELNIDGKNYFNTEVFGLESKKIDPSRKQYCASSHIDTETQYNMYNLFKSFDKIEFMRIDCRIARDGTIFILELSPDCYIGTNGAFQETLKRAGYNFADTLKLLIDNSINSQNH